MRWWCTTGSWCPPIIVSSSALLLQLPPICFRPQLLLQPWLPSCSRSAPAPTGRGCAAQVPPLADAARRAALAALLGVVQPLPPAEPLPEWWPSCGCEWCCCGASPLRDSACCSSPGEDACLRGVLPALQHAGAWLHPMLPASPPASLRHEGERRAYACGVSGQSKPTTRGEAGTYLTPLLAGEGGTVMLASPAGRKLLPELVRRTPAPAGGLCMGVVCADPASASEFDPFELYPPPAAAATCVITRSRPCRPSRGDTSEPAGAGAGTVAARSPSAAAAAAAAHGTPLPC